MSWTAPRTWAAGEVLTAALLNTHLRDNLIALRMTYGTSLPASPGDGDIHVLVDNAATPTYQWAFRYNASSSNADKWEFLGGPAGYSSVDTSEGTASGSYAALATAGPTFAIPRSGVYVVEIEAVMSDSGGYTPTFSYDIGGTGAVDADAITGFQTVSYRRFKQQKTLAAAVTLTAKYKSAGGGTGTFAQRKMTVTPVRVS